MKCVFRNAPTDGERPIGGLAVACRTLSSGGTNRGAIRQVRTGSPSGSRRIRLPVTSITIFSSSPVSRDGGKGLWSAAATWPEPVSDRRWLGSRTGGSLKIGEGLLQPFDGFRHARM